MKRNQSKEICITLTIRGPKEVWDKETPSILYEGARDAVQNWLDTHPEGAFELADSSQGLVKWV